VAPSRERDGTTEAARGFGPSVLLLPVLVLLAFALWHRTHGARERAAYDEAPAPPIESGRTEVEGWRGTFPWGDPPAVVIVELTPLHADGARQRFEATTLAARFQLPEGAPWRLSLRSGAQRGMASEALPVEGAGSTELAAPGTSTGAGEAERAATWPELVCRGLAVSGFQLLAEAAALDPIASLFAAPAGGLGARESVDLYFWLPAGSDSQRGAGEVGAARQEPCTLSLAGRSLTTLTPTALDAPRTSDSLATVDVAALEREESERRPGTKSATPPSTAR